MLVCMDCYLVLICLLLFDYRVELVGADPLEVLLLILIVANPRCSSTLNAVLVKGSRCASCDCGSRRSGGVAGYMSNCTYSVIPVPAINPPKSSSSSSSTSDSSSFGSSAGPLSNVALFAASAFSNCFSSSAIRFEFVWVGLSE